MPSSQHSDARELGVYPFVCLHDFAVAPFEPMDTAYVPISRRTAEQLDKNAEELRRMAATATTADVARSLLTLANRYTVLAEKRRQQST